MLLPTHPHPSFNHIRFLHNSRFIIKSNCSLTKLESDPTEKASKDPVGGDDHLSGGHLNLTLQQNRLKTLSVRNKPEKSQYSQVYHRSPFCGEEGPSSGAVPVKLSTSSSYLGLCMPSEVQEVCLTGHQQVKGQSVVTNKIISHIVKFCVKTQKKKMEKQLSIKCLQSITNTRAVQRENADAKCALQTADGRAVSGSRRLQHHKQRNRNPKSSCPSETAMPGPPAATCIFWIRCLSEEQQKGKTPPSSTLAQTQEDSRGRETACTGVTEAYEPPPLESELSHLSLQPLKKTFIPPTSVENQLPMEGKIQEVKIKK